VEDVLDLIRKLESAQSRIQSGAFAALLLCLFDKGRALNLGEAVGIVKDVMKSYVQGSSLETVASVLRGTGASSQDGHGSAVSQALLRAR